MSCLSRENIESPICSIEHTYAVQITIVDTAGFFHDHAGHSVFSRQRHSHRKNPVCDRQFGQRCIDHCRHAMNKMSEEKREPFEHSCWKGVSEIVVPLVLNEVHVGMCYFGLWKSPVQIFSAEQNQIKAFWSRAYLHAYEDVADREQSRVDDLRKTAPFVAQSLVFHAQQFKTSVQAPSDNVCPRTQLIYAFLQQRPGQELTLADLSQEMSLSASRCSHVVKERTGKSLSELISNERIQRACQLLHNSDDSVRAIAECVGFQDQYYFNKMFKSIIGMPPGRYRKQ